MPLPSSGQIDMNMVNVELGRGATQQIDMNNSFLRDLFDLNTSLSQISLSNGYGKAQKARLELLIVAGGGGGGGAPPDSVGGGGSGGGGGGITHYNGGSFLTYFKGQSLSVIVGGGGSGGYAYNPPNGTAGNSSSFAGITSTGGGGGGGGYTPNGGYYQGGAGGNSPFLAGMPGSGARTPGQNNPAGPINLVTQSNIARAASGAGGIDDGPLGGAGYYNEFRGGDGALFTDWGTAIDAGNIYVSGGGAATTDHNNAGYGGGGGGGQSGFDGQNGFAGQTNRGGGGGGAGQNATGGNGGSGIVIIRYTLASGVNATGGTKKITTPWIYHVFTSSGTFSII